MTKKLLSPRIKKISETYFGKQLNDPQIRERHAHIVQQLREEAKEEIASLERSERLTKDDLGVVINARADDLHFGKDEG